ncbi:hypothetical protein [Paenibacillus ihumii]|uniref:hypothetical protein n=1 Tax=Paenibacillus ihumii TaxID=687436 RepID=UPI0006D7F97E|nr:hypothetical protein [Paenibacillus ihumii]
MSLLNDGEKVAFLIEILNRHIQKLPCGDTFRNYLESICGVLKHDDLFIQKAAIANSELFIEALSNILSNQITIKQAIGALIAAFDKVGYVDSMDVAAIILEFEQLLNQMSIEEAENLYNKHWK